MTASLPRDVRRFATEHEGVEAIVQRIGRETWDLVVVDRDGNWTRGVLNSKEDCERAAADLGIEQVHDGWNDDLSRRVNRRDNWNEPGGQRRAL